MICKLIEIKNLAIKPIWAIPDLKTFLKLILLVSTM